MKQNLKMLNVALLHARVRESICFYYFYLFIIYFIDDYLYLGYLLSLLYFVNELKVELKQLK